ncbi:MAG: hypothetical protein C5B51_15765 [Terriglobia bacterium]|nr:MAG: hypothetical protein C5B51_15765 [Terriglobia bacterium]
MRILALDQFSELGGGQRMLLDLLPAIRSRGWEAAVALPGDGPVVERLCAQNCTIFPIDCGPYSSGRKSAGDLARFAGEAPRLARQIRRLAAQFQPDLLYINGPRLLPAVAWARPRVPALFHAHIEVSQILARRLAGVSLRRLNAHVVAVCHEVAKVWQPLAARNRVTVIYNGVPRPAGTYPHGPAGTRIGCIGRIMPEKGQRDFLEAAAQIHKALPDSRFVIAGAALFSDANALSYEKEIRNAAAGMPVEFTGWVSDVYAAMAQLDLLLVPSVWQEANPRVVLEAFAAGLPVIAFRAGGVPEIIDHGRTGFLCANAEEMARLAIDLLQGDRTRLCEVAAAARERWRRDFTLERWQDQMLAEMECVTEPRA